MWFMCVILCAISPDRLRDATVTNTHWLGFSTTKDESLHLIRVQYGH